MVLTAALEYAVVESLPPVPASQGLGKRPLLLLLSKIHPNLLVIVLEGMDNVVTMIPYVAQEIARIMADAVKRILWFELVRTKC